MILLVIILIMILLIIIPIMILVIILGICLLILFLLSLGLSWAGVRRGHGAPRRRGCAMVETRWCKARRRGLKGGGGGSPPPPHPPQVKDALINSVVSRQQGDLRRAA